MKRIANRVADRIANGMSGIHSALIAGLMLVSVAVAAETLLVPAPVRAASTVLLEGIVVTPKKVYTETEWQWSRARIAQQSRVHPQG